MPILSCGFEAGDLAYYTNLGWRANGTPTIDQQFVHRDDYGYGGDFSVKTTDGGGVYCPKIPESETPRWLHCWIYTEDTSWLYGWNIAFVDADLTTHITVRIEPTGYIQIRRGNWGGTLLATSSNALTIDPNGKGFWLAIEVVIANSGGIVNVYVSGETPSPYVSYSGDTQNGGRATWNRFGYNEETGLIGYIDDIIITDVTEGQKTEKFLKRMFMAGDGTTAFTPSSGSDNWPNVQSYDTDTYNYTGSATTSDLYTVDPSPKLGTIDYIAVEGLIAGKNSFEAQVALKSNITTVYGTLTPVTSYYQPIPTEFWDEDPDTSSAWTEAGAKAMQVGLRTGT